MKRDIYQILYERKVRNLNGFKSSEFIEKNGNNTRPNRFSVTGGNGFFDNNTDFLGQFTPLNYKLRELNKPVYPVKKIKQSIIEPELKKVNPIKKVVIEKPKKVNIKKVFKEIEQEQLPEPNYRFLLFQVLTMNPSKWLDYWTMQQYSINVSPVHLLTMLLTEIHNVIKEMEVNNINKYHYYETFGTSRTYGGFSSDVAKQLWHAVKVFGDYLKYKKLLY